MALFTLIRGATPLCIWDVETGNAAFHPESLHPEEMLALGEVDRLQFVLDDPVEATNYRIKIGDFHFGERGSGTEGGYEDYGDRLLWPRRGDYLESARGVTEIVLESQSESSETNVWNRVFVARVNVLPSKLGEDRYQRMQEDLNTLGRSLLVDLYGKSSQTYDLRFAREAKACKSPEQELASIEATLESLAFLLLSIGQRPASRFRTIPFQQRYWGGERLSPQAIKTIGSRGASLRTLPRPVTVPGKRKAESFDIPEHRVIRWFLSLLVRRAVYCEKVADSHIRRISDDRRWRDIRFDDEPTLYEKQDLPRIRRLEQAKYRAQVAGARATGLATLPFLRESKPELISLGGGTFHRNLEYQSLLCLIRRFLITSAIWYEGDEVAVVTKLTSRLFEQWCYLRIIESFRKCGLVLYEWTEVLRGNLSSRFILDFYRGLTFEGNLAANLRLRFRYEPLILARESAIEAGESLYRSDSRLELPWCPDVVIECLKSDSGTWKPLYCIVLDSKYTARIREHHWNQTRKYLRIRSTFTGRQVVRQLWLIAPSDQPSIVSEDEEVRFEATGPTCEPNETVQFRLEVVPTSSGAVESTDPFDQFASGTVSFLLREFCAP